MTSATVLDLGTVAIPRAQARAVDRLRRDQRYAPFRRVVGRSGFRAVSLALSGTGTLIGVAVLAGLGRWLAVHAAPATTLTGAAIVSLVASAVIARRAVSHQSRARVLAPPDAGLLQALDVRAPEVFLGWVGRAIVVWHVVLLAAQVLFLGSLGSLGRGAQPAWWLLALPVGACVFSLGLAAQRCSVPRAGQSGLGGLAVRSGLAAATGLAAGRSLDAMLSRGSVAVPDEVAGTLVSAAAPAALLLAAAGAILATTGLRRLSDLTWGHGRLDEGHRRSPASEYARMREMVSASALAGSVFGIWRTVVLLASFGAGMVAAGPHLPPTLQELLGPLLTGYAFVTVLLASGVVFSVVGPSVMIARFRFLWENSDLGASTVAARGLAYPLAVVVVPSTLLTTAQSVLTGHLTLRTLALGITLIGSAVIAETLLPVAHHADGTITYHPLTAWVVLLVSVPAAAMPVGVIGGLLSMGYALICLGVGHRCLTRRILRLPLSSAA